MMLEYVPQLEVEGLTAVPQYFHNAVLYSRHFCFLDARAQGRFQAACRDLLDEGLAPASWWVARQEVDIVDRVTGERRPYVWEPEKILRALSSELKERLTSPAYQEACQQAMDQVEFRRREESLCTPD